MATGMSDLHRLDLFSAVLSARLASQPRTPSKTRRSLSPPNSRSPQSNPSPFTPPRRVFSPPGSSQSSPTKYSLLSMDSSREYYPTNTSVSTLSHEDDDTEDDLDVFDDIFAEEYYGDDEDSQLWGMESSSSDEELGPTPAERTAPPEMLDEEFVFRTWEFDSVRRVICPNPRYHHNTPLPVAPLRSGSPLPRALSPIFEEPLDVLHSTGMERDIEEEATLRRDQWELQRAMCGVAWVDPIEVTVSITVEGVKSVDSRTSTTRNSASEVLRPRVFFRPQEIEAARRAQ